MSVCPSCGPGIQEGSGARLIEMRDAGYTSSYCIMCVTRVRARTFLARERTRAGLHWRDARRRERTEDIALPAYEYIVCIISHTSDTHPTITRVGHVNGEGAQGPLFSHPSVRQGRREGNHGTGTMLPAEGCCRCGPWPLPRSLPSTGQWGSPGCPQTSRESKTTSLPACSTGPPRGCGDGGIDFCGTLDFCQDGDRFGYALPGDRCQPYNGPTIRLIPGSRYRLTLRNTATVSTNIHTHGLHIVGAGDSDDATRSVGAGECLDYTWDITDDHPGGTH